MFAKWETIEDFNLWHTQIKEQLGIPLPDGVTTEYTEAIPLGDGSFCAFVHDEYAEGLIETTQPLPPAKPVI